jgi:hypothetical protein
LKENQKKLPRLAIAARYDADQFWYRARILDKEPTTTSDNLLIEFVDYGI